MEFRRLKGEGGASARTDDVLEAAGAGADMAVGFQPRALPGLALLDLPAQGGGDLWRQGRC